MEFKAIETQEEFDAAIRERIERAKETAVEPFKDYETLKNKNGEYEAVLAEIKKKSAEYETKIAELNSKNKSYETNSAKMRIALEMGVPFELSDRLAGEDEESIRKDAERISKLINTSGPSEPPASTEGDLGNEKDAAYKLLLKQTKGE